MRSLLSYDSSATAERQVEHAGQAALLATGLSLLTNVGLDPAAQAVFRQRASLYHLLAVYLKAARHREVIRCAWVQRERCSLVSAE
jgi:hypothetical protein